MEVYFENMAPRDGTKEKLLRDLVTLVQDAEDLVAATGDQMAAQTRHDLQNALDKLRASATRVQSRAAATARSADRLIRANPYQTVGLALGVGLLIGVLVARK